MANSDLVDKPVHKIGESLRAANSATSTVQNYEQGGANSNRRAEVHMLKLYAVKVWHTSEPRHFETIEVRTYTAQRAEQLATESFPGCKAHTFNVPVEGATPFSAHELRLPRGGW